MPKTYRLLGPNGLYESSVPGTLGGNGHAHIYGRLNCSSALRALKQGDHYARHRVFFADEATAIATDYRPCGTCMRAEYRAWKAARQAGSPTGG